MNNWDSFIKAIVPLSFMAIWALTSLFNRDSKAKLPQGRLPMAQPRPGPAVNPTGPLRSSDPTLRWNTTATGGSARPQTSQRPSRANQDDGIVILASDNRNDREVIGRSSVNLANKRPTKGKPVIPQRKAEPTAPRSRLAGVSQNVNQHLTNSTIDMTPLETLTPAAIPSLGLSSAPSLATATATITPRTATALALTDPARLREAFIMNEILQPPVSIRNRRGGTARH